LNFFSTEVANNVDVKIVSNKKLSFESVSALNFNQNKYVKFTKKNTIVIILILKFLTTFNCKKACNCTLFTILR